MSIIIPTRNRPRELLNALLHLRKQSYRNFEIIIVDNSSKLYKEMNKKVLEVFRNINHVTMKYIDISPAYPSIVRNIGISHSHGDYIAFLDDDDYWLPRKLLAQVRKVKEGYDFVFTGFVRVSHKGRIRYRYCPKEDVIKHPLTLLKRQNFIATSSVLLKKKLLNEVGGFDEDLPALENYDLWLRIAEVEILRKENIGLLLTHELLATIHRWGNEEYLSKVHLDDLIIEVREYDTLKVICQKLVNAMEGKNINYIRGVLSQSKIPSWTDDTMKYAEAIRQGV